MSGVTDAQRGVVAFLADPRSYGPDVIEVERHETHISHVFLAGDRAYKLKRAVAFPYLDFSTVERRHRACRAELALNRRTAPELYLEVRAIARRTDGTFAWGDAGEVVDWVVVMRRFPQDRRFDAMAAAGELSPALLRALAAHIAAFHAAAEPVGDRGGADAVMRIVAENDSCLRTAPSGAFAAASVRELRDRAEAWLRRNAHLLDRRRDTGKVRRCHGDLHLRNICVLDGKPVLFDCIEFSEDFACIDVLYDLAFLLMDLRHAGHAEAANRVFNRYLDLTGDDGGLAAVPLFLSLRAGIRAHVTALAGAPAAPDARRYLDEACAALRPVPPRLVAVGGRSGTGKSTVAAAVAADLGVAPGARVLRSDVVRKRLFGRAPEERLPTDAYGAEVTERVYAAVRSRASDTLRAGYSAIVDAVSLRAEERHAFAELARREQVPFTGLWLEAPAAVMSARVGAREPDASDATAEIVERQLSLPSGAIDWHRIDAGGTAGETIAAARKLLSVS